MQRKGWKVEFPTFVSGCLQRFACSCLLSEAWKQLPCALRAELQCSCLCGQGRAHQGTTPLGLSFSLTCPPLSVVSFSLIALLIKCRDLFNEHAGVFVSQIPLKFRRCFRGEKTLQILKPQLLSKRLCQVWCSVCFVCMFVWVCVYCFSYKLIHTRVRVPVCWLLLLDGAMRCALSIILLFYACIWLFRLHSPRQELLVAKRDVPWSWQ